MTNRRTELVAQLETASEVVQTGVGPVEYQRHGEAPYILFLHGTPGGHNQGLFAEDFVRAGFGIIIPSRPGYLRTPLATGAGFDAAADACAALLTALDVPDVVVYAVSGGGPTGIEFAARHPGRTKALLLEVAVSGTYAPDIPTGGMAMLSSPIVAWLQDRMLAWFPRMVVRQMVKMESTLPADDLARVTNDILSNPGKLELLRRLIGEMAPFELVRAGFENDMSRFASIEQLPMAQVRCPTLVTHGTHDDDVPFAHAERAVREISGAQLQKIEKGWHSLALGDEAEEVRRGQLEFLRKNTAA